VKETDAEMVVDTLPTVIADEWQIVQLLQNLLSNALKFHGKDRPVIRISSSTRPHGFVISVKDNGIGLSVAHKDRIFQMSQRLHSTAVYPGTGVGLAVAKKNVERHGGRIWVESEEGKAPRSASPSHACKARTPLAGFKPRL
jgi:light-regulated signal transduction histidine kinase (bacteriophytochrome)